MKSETRTNLLCIVPTVLVLLIIISLILVLGTWGPATDRDDHSNKYVGVVVDIDTYGGDGLFASGIETRITMEDGTSFEVTNYEDYTGIQVGWRYIIWTKDHLFQGDGEYITKYEYL